MLIIFLLILAIIGLSLMEFWGSRDWQSATSIAKNQIIFEKRNKRYGAYKLRSDYNDTLMFILIGCIAFVMIINLMASHIRTPRMEVAEFKMDTTLLKLEAPPLQEIETLPTPFKVVGGGRGSAGSPTNDPVDKHPKEQSKSSETIENSDVHVRAGSSSRDIGENKDNKATTVQRSENPFGGGGASKGEGTGIFGKDLGAGAGNGSGDGIGNGHGNGSARKKLTSLNAEDIQSNVDCTIHLKVTINSEGSVIRAVNDGSRTNTSDNALISRIIELVKRQVKYEKSPGASPQIQELTINVKAS